MKIDVNGLEITYPDLAFAYNPIRVFVDKLNTGYTAIEANGVKIERETSPTVKNISFDLSALAQSLFDRLDFYKIEERDTILLKTIDFKIYDKEGSTHIAKGSIPVLWGALQIGERYTQSKTLTYFPGFPFTVPLYVEADSKIVLKANGVEFKTVEAGKYNIDVSSVIKSNTTIEIFDEFRRKLFDYTFNHTFGPQRMIVSRSLYINVNVNDCPNDGVYLRWINKHSEYNYYLFQSSNKSATTKSNSIKFSNVYYTTDITNGYHQGRGRNIGKDIEQSMKLFAPLVNSETVDFLQDLVESPIVDMFLGYGEDKVQKWIAVNIQDGTFAKSTSVLQDFEFLLIPNNKIVQIL